MLRPIPSLIAILALFAVLAFWFHTNLSVQSWDPMVYFLKSQDAYLANSSSGFLGGMKSIWAQPQLHKPSLHPIFGFFALILSRGNVQWATFLSNACAYVTLLFFSALILLEDVPPIESAIGVLLLGSHPWTFAMSVQFFAEIYLLSFLMAFLYFWRKSENFRRGWPSAAAAIAAAGAVASRPVEALAFLALPLAMSCAVSIRKKTWPPVEAALTGLSLLLTATMFVLCFRQASETGDLSLFRWLPAYLCAQALVAAIIYWVRSREKGSRLDDHAGIRLFEFFWLWQLLITCWLAPSAGSISVWFQLSTWGPNTVLTDKSGFAAGRLAFALDVFRQMAGLPMLILLAVCVLLKRRPKALWILPWLALPIAFGSMTENPDMRYYLAFFVGANLVLIKLALAPRSSSKGIRIAAATIVATIALLQTAYVASGAAGSEAVAGNLSRFFGGPLWRVVASKKPDPFQELLSKLFDALPHQRRLRVTFLPVEFLDAKEDGGRSQFNGTPLWLVLTRERGDQIDFVRIPPSLNYRETLSFIVSEKIDYAVVPKVSVESDSLPLAVDSSQLALKILREGARFGAKPIASLSLETRHARMATFDIYRTSTLLTKLKGDFPGPPLVISPVFF